MKYVFFLMIAIALWPHAAAAQDAQVVQDAAYVASLPAVDVKAHEIDMETLKQLVKDGALVLDLRTREAYDASHLPDAIYFGPDVDEKRLQDIAPSKDAMIVLYCTNSLAPTRMISQTTVALPQILFMGYKNVRILGPVWQDAGQAQAQEPVQMEQIEIRD